MAFCSLQYIFRVAIRINILSQQSKLKLQLLIKLSEPYSHSLQTPGIIKKPHFKFCCCWDICLWFKSIHSWSNQLRYYVIFKVRKLDLFCKINIFCKKNCYLHWIAGRVNTLRKYI